MANHLILVAGVVVLSALGVKFAPVVKYRNEVFVDPYFHSQVYYWLARQGSWSGWTSPQRVTVVGTNQVNRFTGTETGRLCLWYKDSGFKAMEARLRGGEVVTAYWETDGALAGVITRLLSDSSTSSSASTDAPERIWARPQTEPTAPWLYGDQRLLQSAGER